MRYQQLGSGATYPYPDHDIDPAKKGRAWCMAFAKAAYSDWSNTTPKGMFHSNGGDYEKFKMYAMGKQPNLQYKTWLGVDEATNETWLSVDWSIRSIISPYRDKAISRMMDQELGIVATPIDITAHAELENFYADLKANFAVRELIKGVNENLTQHPLIAIQQGDPVDMEELEMRVSLGEPFNRSKDAELAIAVGFYENDYTHVRRMIYEDLFDYGVAGYKEWLGPDNKAKFRRVNVDSVITNFCRQSNFSDLTHAAEVIDVSLVDLATQVDKDGNRVFTEEELVEFAGSIAGKFGNGNTLGGGVGFMRPYDKFKCKVLDIEFFTYNELVYRDSVDENGNNDYRKADYGRGKKSDKYSRKRIKYVYKCKWVIGTDKCYDFGPCDDQKRSANKKKKAQTSLSYKFYASV